MGKNSLPRYSVLSVWVVAVNQDTAHKKGSLRIAEEKIDKERVGILDSILDS